MCLDSGTLDIELRPRHGRRWAARKAKLATHTTESPDTEVCMNSLQGSLVGLRGGATLQLESCSNQYGDRIGLCDLRFDVCGGWLLQELSCWGASALGMGNCACVSHDPRRESQISRREALSLIRKFMLREEGTRAAAAAEVAWLDQAISESGRCDGK